MHGGAIGKLIYPTLPIPYGVRVYASRMVGYHPTGVRMCGLTCSNKKVKSPVQ